MKILIISLCLFFTVNAQTIRYVDKDATGLNNGTSWTDAWTNLDQFTWETTISAGDTIYVSDGDYAGVELISGLNPTELNNGDRIYYSTQVLVTRSYEVGHTGTVTFIKDEAEERAFRTYGICNVKFNGFTFSNIADVYTDNGNYSNCSIGYDSLIVMDSCRFVTIGNPSAALGIGYAEKITVQNSTIETISNTYARAYDIMTFGSGKGGMTFINNTINQRSAYVGISGTANGMTANGTTLTDTDLALVEDYHKHSTVHVGESYMFVDSNSTNTFYGASWTGGTPSNATDWYISTAQHRDFIQWSDFTNTDPEFNLLVFDKNFMLILTPEANAYNMLIYSVSDIPQAGRMVFTNNILVVETAGITPLQSCGGEYAIQNYTNGITGTANAGVTTDNTSLTDTRLSMQTNYYVGCVLTCNSKIMTVTSNDGDTFSGTGWSGGDNPGNGLAWSLNTMNLNHLNWTILNNTFITPNGGLSIDPFDSMIVKNNFFIGNCATSEAVMGLGYSNTQFDTSYKDINYNHYYFPSWDSDVRKFRIYGGTSRNWGDWQAEGVDVNSDTGYISLADVRDSVISAYMPTSQLQGTDLSDYGVTEDILGNPRTVWTIGALEFDDATDTIPTFSFTPVTGATRGQTYTTTSVFTAVDSTFHVSTTTGASFKVGVLSNYGTAMVEADSGDTVYVQNTASGSYSDLNRETIVAGGYARNFDVTTGSAPVAGTKKTFRLSNGQILKDSSGKIIRTAE